MTLPQVQALATYWRHFPPASMSLARIANGLGISKPEVASPTAMRATVRPINEATAKAAIEQACAAGLGLVEGRPNDPMLDLVGW